MATLKGKFLSVNSQRTAINGRALGGDNKPKFILGIPPFPDAFLPSIPFNSVGDFNFADTPDGISPLGTPIYGRITLGTTDPNGTNSYTDAQGNAGSYQTVELDCALVTVDFNNKVVVTNIQGLPQSIKEFMSNGDNDVTITGLYNSTPGVAPLEFMLNLNKIFSAPLPIPVENYYLNNLDIYYIVIMPGTQMGQTEGGYATQAFTIKAITDTPSNEMLP